MALLSSVGAVRGDEAWPFVLPEPGTEHEYPPLRAIPLSNEKPDDLKEKADWRGPSRRYAQLRYGSHNAARVAIVVDQISPGEVDLYVDTNRNRTIEPHERASGEGRLWRVPLNVEYAQGDLFKRFPRELIFRLGSTGRTLSYAAAGYLEGKLPLPDGEGIKLVTVRRTDGDGNGLFTDPQDRLWIDLDRDGRWNQVAEQFLYATILTIEGERYAVRSDEKGTRLALVRLEGSGSIELAVRQKPTPNEGGVLGRVAEISVTLVGRDGSAVGLRGLNAKVAVPIGEYRVSALAVALDDPSGGPRWNFVFSDSQPSNAKRWYELTKDTTLSIDPLEKFEFSTGPSQADGKCRAGDDLTFQPKLFTVDGLLINTCYRGTHDTGRDNTIASIKLAAGDGAVLAVAQSGFA